MSNHISSMTEERHHPRHLNFCLVFNSQGNLWAIATDLSLEGIRLTIPKTFLSKDAFSLTLKREDAQPPKQVTLIVQPVWRKEKNSYFDEMGVKIVEVESDNDFQTFITYCQQNSPNGLFSSEHPATQFLKTLRNCPPQCSE